MSQYFGLLNGPSDGAWCQSPGCQFFSLNKQALAEHANEEHIGYELFSCPTCPSKFLTFGAVTEHLTQAHLGSENVPTVVNLECLDDGRPFLTIRHAKGEADLFLRGTKLVVSNKSL